MAEIIDDLKHWEQADREIESKNYNGSLNLFNVIQPQSKIYFNIGWLYFHLEHFHRSIEFATKALQLDKFLAAAFQLRALSYYRLACMNDKQVAASSSKRNSNKNNQLLSKAITDSCNVVELIKENTNINYTQLENPTLLYKSHILYNISFFHKLSGDMDRSIETITTAFKLDPQNKQIKNAFIKSKFEDIMDFPNHFMVNQRKVKNLDKKKYMKAGKVIFNLRNSVQNYKREKVKAASEIFEADVDDLLLYYQLHAIE